MMDTIISINVNKVLKQCTYVYRTRYSLLDGGKNIDFNIILLNYIGYA